MWKLLLRYLLQIISPCVAGDDETPPPDDETPPPDDETPPPNDDEEPPPDDDEELPPDDEEPAPRLSRAQKDIIATRQRAQKAEEDLAKANRELAEARRQPQQAAQPTQEQLIWQQEDEVLRNPDSSDWQKYAVNAARASRQANFNSQDAIRRAEDLSDKTTFRQYEVTKPKLYEKYKDRVEQTLADIRAKGMNAPREAILARLIGDDMLAGKLKTEPAKSVGARRAATPGVRSDVSASGGRMTEAEKREKRLENVRI